MIKFAKRNPSANARVDTMIQRACRVQHDHRQTKNDIADVEACAVKRNRLAKQKKCAHQGQKDPDTMGDRGPRSKTVIRIAAFFAKAG